MPSKHSLLVISFYLLSLISAFPVYLSQASGDTIHFHAELKFKSQGKTTITTNTPSNVVSSVNAACEPWKSTCWSMSHHGSFIPRRPVNKGDGNEDETSLVAYTALYTQRRGEGLLAPAVIMLVMMWLAVLAVGIVEGIEFVLERCGWKGDGEDDCLRESCDEEKTDLSGTVGPRCWNCSLTDDRDDGYVFE